MSLNDPSRQPRHRPAATADNDLLGADATLEDRQFANLLETGLSGLRTARPDFRDGLGHRLLSAHAQPTTSAPSWWRRSPFTRPMARRRTDVLARLPRRSLLGLAAGAAVALVAASLLGPFGGAPEASASDILDLSEARAANPVLAGIKSFHLTATSWGADRPDGANNTATEQWFVAPDKMRTESRAKDGDGKTIVSGILSTDGILKQYTTAGAIGRAPISLFMAPIGQKPSAGAPPLPAPGTGSGAPSANGAFTTASQPAAQGTEAGVSVSTSKPGGEGRERDMIFVAARQPDGGDGPSTDGKPEDGQPQVIRIGPGCPEPRRTGEEVIAGRQTFKIEHDLSSCLPTDAPAKIPTRTVSWVDTATYLPLKLEGYDKTGKLLDRYEVSSIEYDVTIPDTIFTRLPDGVTVEDAQIRFGPPPDGDGKSAPGTPVGPPAHTR